MTQAPAKRHFVLFAVVAVLGLSLDLASKSYAFHKLGHPSVNGGKEAWLIEGFCGFQTSLNEGALFGLGQGYAWAFITLAFVALLGIGSWFALGAPGKDKLLTVVLAMLVAGILGNLYDRMGLPAWEGDWTWPVDTINTRAGIEHAAGDRIYAVRDFILFRFGSYQWPNFNIADSLLVCGVALMFLHAYVLEPRQRKRESGKADATEVESA
ncbi:MAG: signal peptidase II [Pirellulales bacterium]|nr:signal peptidase II [Pirellulales bacterium]